MKHGRSRRTNKAKSAVARRVQIGKNMKNVRAAWILGAIPFVAIPFAACSSSSPESPAGHTVAALDETTLGTAKAFRVLGGAAITNTGSTTIIGDVGVSPGLSIGGFPPGLVTGGVLHAGDAVALQAQADLTNAYNVAAGQVCSQDISGQDLGGKTLKAGVYCFSSAAQLTGVLTLDAEGNPDATFVFKIGSMLTTASNSSVLMINNAQDCHLFWQIGSSATFGTTTSFRGTAMALTSISLTTGAKVSGRALARNGAVTMDTNHLEGGTCATADAGAGGAGGAGGADAGMGGAGGKGGAGGAGGADAGACCVGVQCAGTCVDVSGDIANCGACGHACAQGEFCGGGTCTACSTVCGGSCADIGSDTQNCGACGKACAAGEQCGSGACTPCPNVCGGACVDVGSDAANCGACGNACLATQVCSSGACVACATTICFGACVDLSSNAGNCSACGNTCALGESCVAGACVCQ